LIEPFYEFILKIAGHLLRRCIYTTKMFNKNFIIDSK